MMFRFLVTLTFLMMLAGSVAGLLAAQKGRTVMQWFGWQIETSTSLVLAVVIALIILVVMLDRMLGFIAGLPLRLGRWWRRHSDEAGHEALALGLVAASIGDRREALRQEKIARRMIGETTLIKLLSAQVAALEGKADVASQYFLQLTENPGTAYFGEAGLMVLGIESGDDEAALAAGRTAFARKKGEPSLARALFTLEARNGHWPEAIAALAVARRDTKDEAARQQADMAMAVLHYLYASDLEAAGDTAAALKRVEQGLGFAPGLTPAALMAGRLWGDKGRNRKAVGILEKAFVACPHPDSAEALMEMAADKPRCLTRLMQLADQGGGKPEALRIAAEMAARLELWGEARRLMEMIAEDKRDAAGWMLMAQIARHAPPPSHKDDGGDDGGRGNKHKTDKHKTDGGAWPNADECLHKAATAPRGAAWQCRSCGMTAEAWGATCSGCEGFASLVWRRPVSAGS